MREAAANLEFEEAARLRDEVKRLNSVELQVLDDPMARDVDGGSAIQPAAALWPKGKQRRAGSKGGRPGTRTYKGKGR